MLVSAQMPDTLSEAKMENNAAGSTRLHPQEPKSPKNVPQECIPHSQEAKEAENAADGIRRKPKFTIPKIFDSAILFVDSCENHYLYSKVTILAVSFVVKD